MIDDLHSFLLMVFLVGRVAFGSGGTVQAEREMGGGGVKSKQYDEEAVSPSGSQREASSRENK